MPNTEFEVLPSISLGRQSFAAHYNFEDEFIFIIGGNTGLRYYSECEKFDIHRQKWTSMPSMNRERSNAGVFLSSVNDQGKQYIYAFNGFCKSDQPN